MEIPLRHHFQFQARARDCLANENFIEAGQLDAGVYADYLAWQ